MEFNLNSMFGVKDRVVVFTGGCGGFGSGLAEILSELGAKVALVDMNEDRLNTLATEIEGKTGNMVRGYTCNITQADSVRDAFAKIYADFGSVYGLVNCAGTSHVEYLSTMDIEDWQKVMDVNLRGTVLCTKIAGDYMVKGGIGRVINISSLAATHGKPGYTAYTPSKSAVDSFTFTLAAEWGRKNITVNSISPVFMMTAVNREQWKDKPDIEAKIASGNPQGRNCSPELLSGLVTFLLSESASYVNGQNIGCDGGAKHGEISDSFPPEGVGTLQGHQKR